MGLFKDIQDALASIPLNAVLRERLARAGDDEEALHDRIRALEEENSCLKKAVAELTTQIQKQFAASEYVEHAGALFKRKPGGGYHLSIYCPSCQKAAAFMPSGMVACGACGWIWRLKKSALHMCISELDEMDKRAPKD
jgi:hypothetical protein